MTVDDVTQIIRSGLYTIIISAAPLLLISLVVGLVISVFQTVTSIQEQTLTFVPKFVGIFLALIVLGHWMLGSMSGFMVDLWSRFAEYIK